jgi:sugar phosphate isomerase/epimerase
MRFGICAGLDKAAAVKAAGWDYCEGGVGPLFKGKDDDAAWDASGTLAAVKASPLPVPAANSLVPADLKITGPHVSLDALVAYMTNVLKRAGKCGTKTLVFGSGGARNVPDGFDRTKARDQIVAFLTAVAPIAQQHGVTLVCEPLNKGECNIINSVAEGMEYVKAVNHPNFQCLVDSYHFWLEDEPLKNLEAAMPWIKHVHLADKVGRVAPGLSGQSDYKPFFAVLKRGGYNLLVSFEGKQMENFDTTAPKVLDYVKREWEAA